MKREYSNMIRWFMEDVIPPVIRDTRAFSWLMVWGYDKLVHDLADFRKNAHKATAEEYDAIYRRIRRIHETTDNTAAARAAIAKHIVPGNIIDVGCGTGYMLEWLQKQFPEGCKFTGVDFQIPDAVRNRLPGVTLVEQSILSLPFPDRAFDTVICTHVLEHILDIRAAVQELRRICAKRLILAVPREREGIYTFNPHLHFFPYTHSFLRAMIPLPDIYHCEDIDRDIFYWENVAL